MSLKQSFRRETILFLLLWTFLCFYESLAAQEFEIQPTDITVKRGASVNLPCKVKNLKGVLQWTMGGFGLGTDRELKAFPRFMMLGSNETGNYTLHITAALLADEAEYQCQVSGTESEAPLRSSTAKLTVLYPPKDDEDQVYIHPESPLQAIAGSTVRITCRGGLTKPASKIIWKKDNVTITVGVSELKEPLPNSMLESITSWVDVVPDKSFHKKNISCFVTHEALETPIVRSLTMYVQYPPAVTIAKHFIKAKEGDNLKFTCAADGNPPNLRFRWEVNQVSVTGDFETEFTFKKVTRLDNQAKVTCIVSNAVGNGKAEETISVEYEPKFKEEPKDVDEDKGKTVTLKCLVESNPPPEIVWTHENSQKVIGHGAEWGLTVDDTTQGIYRCRIATPGYSEISRSVEVFLRGSPLVVPDQISLGLEGDAVDIDCDIKSIPRPVSVEWSRNGVPIDPIRAPKYTIEELPTRKGVRNRLTIREAKAEDFGWYNCTAKNDYGSHTGSVELRKQQSLPLVTTLVAIIGGIIFLVIVSVIIILFRRQGSAYKEHELEKQTDHSSTQDSVLKADSRTATGSDMTPSDDGADYSHDEEWDTSDVTSNSRNVNRRDQDGSYRFSGDYNDPIFPPKTPNTTGAGYIPYVDYRRDFVPPAPINYNRNSLYSPVPTNNAVDLRYSAVYGNPYLRVPPNAKAAQNIYGSDGRMTTSLQETSPSPTGHPNNNLNNVSPNLKNRIYSQIGQNRNNINNNINSQYVMIPQSDGEHAVHGTHI